MLKRHRRHRRSLLEPLESRTLLSAASVVVNSSFVPTYEVNAAGLSPFQTAGAQGYTPAEIRAAYGLNQISFGSLAGNGAGQTIAIIDAYNDPTIHADLHAFDVAFGLSDPTFSVVSQNGSSLLPAVDPVGPGGSNFEGEEALDVEWAHALAPGANILLVEASDASPTNIFAAVNFARQQSGVSVVSMSFGGDETASETQYDSIFTTPAGHTPVTFVASTGDAGVPAGFPAYSPNVLATGGTSLSIDSNGNYQSEIGWSDSGGGRSAVEAKPSYQNTLVSGSTRATPDVAFDADPRTGVAVYDSYNNGTSTPWEVLGGTSVAAPAWAGIIAVADQGRVRAGKATLDSRNNTLPLVYSAPAADFHDITSGNNGDPAQAGYDLVTGRGSPRANLLVPYLVAGTITQPPANSNPTIASVSASAASVTEGAPLTLTANGVSDSGGTGLAVTFYEETNGVAGLQTDPSTGDFAFTPVTDGSNTITLDTTNSTGTFTFYAQLTDSSGKASPAGTSAPSTAVTVTAPSSSRPTIAAISASPTPVVSGDTLTLSVSGVVDPQSSVSRIDYYEETNNVAGLQTGPNGDFAFSPTTAADNFSLDLDTTNAAGSYVFYARAVDRLGNSSLTGGAAPSVSVSILTNAPPATPSGLTATTVSPTQIDLAFSETDSGQTGFTIERSTDPHFATFTRVFSINRPDALTYSDTGLKSGSRYYYRVQAFSPAGKSGFSNTASAATDVAPFGFIDKLGPATVAGWALDPDSPASAVTVELFVDGSMFASVSADVPRPDLMPKYHTSDHGYVFNLSSLAPGEHSLQVVMMDVSTHVPVAVAKARTINTNREPMGSVDFVSAATLAGWAYDPNAGAAPIQIQYNIDASAPVRLTANLARPGLIARIGSANHGFDIALPQLTAGEHTVRVFALDSTTGALSLIGLRHETVSAPRFDPLPSGNLDLLTPNRIAGWAFDSAAPSTAVLIRIDIDGVQGTPQLTSVSRPDVASRVHARADLGFDLPLSLGAGYHTLALYAIDAVTDTPVLIAMDAVVVP